MTLLSFPGLIDSGVHGPPYSEGDAMLKLPGSHQSTTSQPKLPSQSEKQRCTVFSSKCSQLKQIRVTFNIQRNDLHKKLFVMILMPLSCI